MSEGLLTEKLLHYTMSVLTAIVHLHKDRKGVYMIFIDYKDTSPIYEQIVEKFKTLILKGALLPDEKMPSVRNLAVELSINPNTIQRAYGELERQGYIYTVKGKGNFVSDSKLLFAKYKEEIFVQLRLICKQAYEAGITEEELVESIRGGGKDD